MILRHAQARMHRLAHLAIFQLATIQLVAAPTGPTLQFDYGRGTALTNSVSQFMYFVPLISPETVSVFTNNDNSQGACVRSYNCRTNGQTFVVTCEFEFTGNGSQQSFFDHTAKIEQRKKELEVGATLTRQLDFIAVAGAGNGSVEITGLLTNRQRVVTEVRLKFDSHGHSSPVSVGLVDICQRNGKVQFENALTARVNSLIFKQSSSSPKMEVTLASVKRKDSSDSLWQNFMGGLKGVVANLFLPPLSIEANGHQAMMDFGFALATEKSTFTFPFATRLKSVGIAKP